MPYGAKASEEGEGYEEIPGNHVGWQRLGNMYSSNVYGGDFSIEENYDKAFECYSKAADGGKFINLGVQYEYGHGCELDYAKTIELYQKEINEGTEPLAGMVCLATMYVNGWGVEQDYGKALELCNEALAAANPSDDYTIDRAHEWIDLIANNT